MRGGAFSGPGWDEPLRRQMLDLQFEARRADRAARFPHAREEVVVVEGEPVGAVTFDDSAGAVHVLDLVVSASARGRGIGSAVLGELIGRRAARVEVEVANDAARRFYERHGFAGDGDGVTLPLRREVRPATG